MRLTSCYFVALVTRTIPTPSTFQPNRTARSETLACSSPVIPDKELDRLYGLPLGEFTRARDELARDLRKAGNAEGADEVKALAKPSISAWAVNQLARKERMQIRSLLRAGEHLRKAQAEVLGGAGPGGLQEPLQRQREAVAALVESAEGVLSSAGRATTEATLGRIRGTLAAAATDVEGTELLERGRLTRDLDPTGFGGLALEPIPTRPRPRKESKRASDTRKRRVEEARREVDGLRAEVAEWKATARRAKSEVTKAERASEAARKAAAKAEKELARLTERLEAAEEALERARSG
jgi:hypothetical protein